MPKVSLIQNKTAAGQTVQAGAKGEVQAGGAGGLPQGATIVKLLNPGGGAQGAKMLTAVKSIPSIPSNMMTMSKAQGVAGKQTIVITKPGAGQQVLGRTNAGQIIMVTTGAGIRAVQTFTNSQAATGNVAYADSLW